MYDAVLCNVLKPFQWFIATQLIALSAFYDLLVGQPHRSVAKRRTIKSGKEF